METARSARGWVGNRLGASSVLRMAFHPKLLCFVFLAVVQLAQGQSQIAKLRLARLYDPATLDPAKVALSEDFLLLPLLYQSLLDVKGGTNLVPKAACEWSTSSDKRVFTFKLRPGVRFSNGREVVAADYVFALEYTLNPATAAGMSSYLKGIRGQAEFSRGITNHVSGLRAPSADTLVIELERPDPMFGFIMASSPGIAIPPEEVARFGSSFSVNPVGQGPYMVRQWKRGVRLQLVRNPYYHGIEPQHLDGVDILIGGDRTTHLMMFERGELDIAESSGIDGVPYTNFRRLTTDPRWSNLVEYVDGFSTMFLNLNVEMAPFTNVLVRRAVCCAINRDRWMHVFTRRATHANGIIPPIMPGFNPSLKGYNYDPERARQLLRQASLPMPLRTVFWHDLSDTARVLAEGVQSDLKQVGIEAELKGVTYAQLVSAMGNRGQVPMAYTGWGPLIPDPVDLLGQLFDGRTITNATTWNEAFYQNPEVDRLLDEGAPETDLKRRYSLYQRVEQMIIDDAPVAVMGHLNTLALRQPWLEGPLIDALMGYRFDRIWIKKHN